MICTLLPQDDCIWTFYFHVLVGKDKIFFYRVNLMNEWSWLRLNQGSWELQLILSVKYKEVFKTIQCFFKMTDNHFSKVHRTLLNVMIYDIVLLHLFASLCSLFEPIVTYFLCTSTLCCYLLIIGKLILYLFFIPTFCTCPVIFQRLRTPALVNK